MGCCETRESRSTISKRRERAVARQHAMKVFSEYQPIQQVFDQRSQELLWYVHTLLDSAKWELVYTEDWLELETVQHSVFQENLQVNKLCFKFSEHLDASLIFEVLNNPKYRLSWDTTLAEMIIEEGDLKHSFTSYRVLSVLGIKRDFYEKMCVGASNETLVSIAYSIEGKDTTITRGRTHFSYMRIVAWRGTTQVEMVNQTDVQLPTQTFAKFVTVRLKAWSKAFFKHVLKAHSVPNNNKP